MDRLSKQSELEMFLHSFRVPSFAQYYQQFAREAEKQKQDHVGYLFSLAQRESEDRYNRKTERLMKLAKLPKGKFWRNLIAQDLDIYRQVSFKRSLMVSA